MSYAGKTAGARRPPLREGTAGGSVRRRAVPPAHVVDREVVVTTSALRRRSLADAEETELDWQRIALFATGALIGAAIGAGTALLLAPQTGEETRRDLARQGRRLRARGADAWDDLRDELRWATQRGRRRIGRTLRNRRIRRQERELDRAEID